VNQELALQVLRQVRDKLGRNYKSVIREAWMSGNYEIAGLSEWGNRLQQIRNALGPTWLVNARP
jgi:hypothetical protein